MLHNKSSFLINRTGALTLGKHNDKQCLKISFFMKNKGYKYDILEFCSLLTNE